LECRDGLCKNPLHSVGGSCTSTSDCSSGLECRDGLCLNPSHSLSFGDRCIYNSECKSDICDFEYKKCLIRPIKSLLNRPLDCGYKDGVQGYYPGSNDSSPAKFCRNVGSPLFTACIVNGDTSNQYVRETVEPSKRIPLISSDQCYKGGILRG
jgi:hypothetical protein